jgi:hypothetical protein
VIALVAVSNIVISGKFPRSSFTNISVAMNRNEIKTIGSGLNGGGGVPYVYLHIDENEKIMPHIAINK